MARSFAFSALAKVKIYISYISSIISIGTKVYSLGEGLT